MLDVFLGMALFVGVMFGLAVLVVLVFAALDR